MVAGGLPCFPDGVAAASDQGFPTMRQPYSSTDHGTAAPSPRRMLAAAAPWLLTALAALIALRA